jgi:hypothetical protein
VDAEDTGAGLGEGSSSSNPTHSIGTETTTTIPPPTQVTSPSTSAKRPLSSFLSDDLISLPEEFTSSSAAVSTSSGKRLKSTKASASKRMTPAKIDPDIAISSMQGTINHLADVLQIMTTSPLAAASVQRMKAMEEIEAEDGLSNAEKIKLVSVLQKDSAAVDIYLSLKNPEIRRGWIDTILTGSEGA